MLTCLRIAGVVSPPMVILGVVGWRAMWSLRAEQLRDLHTADFDDEEIRRWLDAVVLPEPPNRRETADGDLWRYRQEPPAVASKRDGRRPAKKNIYFTPQPIPIKKNYKKTTPELWTFAMCCEQLEEQANGSLLTSSVFHLKSFAVIVLTIAGSTTLALALSLLTSSPPHLPHLRCQLLRPPDR